MSFKKKEKNRITENIYENMAFCIHFFCGMTDRRTNQVNYVMDAHIFKIESCVYHEN